MGRKWRDGEESLEEKSLSKVVLPVPVGPQSKRGS